VRTSKHDAQPFPTKERRYSCYSLGPIGLSHKGNPVLKDRLPTTVERESSGRLGVTSRPGKPGARESEYVEPLRPAVTTATTKGAD
jgi:hypothetical protein